MQKHEQQVLKADITLLQDQVNLLTAPTMVRSAITKRKKLSSCWIALTDCHYDRTSLLLPGAAADPRLPFPACPFAGLAIY